LKAFNYFIDQIAQSLELPLVVLPIFFGVVFSIVSVGELKDKRAKFFDFFLKIGFPLIILIFLMPGHDDFIFIQSTQIVSDPTGKVMSGIFAFLCFMVLGSIPFTKESFRRGSFLYFLYLGASVTFFATDLILMFLGLSIFLISALSFFGLQKQTESTAELTSHFIFLSMSCLFSFSLGTLFVFSASGSLVLSELLSLTSLSLPVALASILFLSLPLFALGGIFPLHHWMGRLQLDSENWLSNIVATLVRCVGIFLLIRMFKEVLLLGSDALTEFLQVFFAICAFGSLFVGGFFPS